jgi:ethanolamine transporter
MRDLNRGLHLGGALIWRGYREQRAKLLVLPLIFAALILTFSLAISFGAIGPSAHRSLSLNASPYVGGLHDNLGRAMAALFNQGPFLIAFFAAFTGTVVAQNSVGSEAARGGLELLLSVTDRVRELIVALLVGSFVLTLIGWVVLALGTLGVAAIVLVVQGASFHLPLAYLLVAVVMPLALAVWANQLSLFLALTFPRLAQMRAGSFSSVLQLVGMAPAYALFLLVNLRPGLDVAWVAGAALGLGIVGSALGVLLVSFRFRPALVLET